jgi:hypothetical protein
VLDDAAAGLFWLDNQLAKQPRGLYDRIPNWALHSACEAGGHRAGFLAMHELNHKVASKKFHGRMVDIADNAEKRAAGKGSRAASSNVGGGDHRAGDEARGERSTAVPSKREQKRNAAMPQYLRLRLPS